MGLIVSDKATMILDGRGEIRSVSDTFPCPSVIRLERMIKRPRPRVKLTKSEIFRRDNYTCQYCGAHEDLTFDHVIPRSLGGQTRWDNVVAACSTCNLAKANKLPDACGMFPKQKPYRPTVYELHRNGRRFPPNYLHESWLDYLYWDTELEP